MQTKAEHGHGTHAKSNDVIDPWYDKLCKRLHESGEPLDLEAKQAIDDLTNRISQVSAFLFGLAFWAEPQSLKDSLKNATAMLQGKIKDLRDLISTPRSACD